MTPKALMLLLAAATLAGCSEGSSLSTSSIFGGSSSTPAAPAAPLSTPTSRAMQVGSTAARATKCGYNFDANKLRNNFLASEAAQAPGADQTNVQKTYDVSFSGVTKAAATKSDYCSEAKTREIKADLSRHLAGDYSPAPPKVEAQEEEGGLFSGWGGGSAPEYKSSLPTDNSRD